MTAQRTKATALRNKRLGEIGECLAEQLLKRNHFVNVENLNSRHRNFPYADFLAEKDAVRYVISVKIRNKFEFGPARRLNSRYKLGRHCYELAAEAEIEYRAAAAFVSISLEERTFSAYFGRLSSLNGSKGISMTPSGVSRYECIAHNEQHEFDCSDLRNEY